MNLKKLIALFLMITILLSQITFLSFDNRHVYAIETETTTEATRYFYNQLTNEAKNIYHAMEKMANDGIFARGEDLDLLANNYVTKDLVISYTNGVQDLLNAVGAARDAFQYDNPDVFYIDYSLLSLRITMSSDGTYHAYLGTGRTDTYLLPGFNSENTQTKIAQYNSKMDSVIQEVREAAEKELQEAKATSGDAEFNEEFERMKALASCAHDWVTEHMVYKFEYQVNGFNEAAEYSNARTAYDCVMYGEGVCEAYGRGYKAILDRLGIPCVCVYGVYKVNDTQLEEHLWNNVKIGDSWYGVDVTHDDPIVKNYKEDNAKSGKETRKFLLVGEVNLNVHHSPSAIMSSANYEFSYPELSIDSIDGAEWYDDGLFRIRAFGTNYNLEDDDDDSNMKTTEIWVSYNGTNYTENAKNGKYLLTRYANYYEKGTKYWDNETNTTKTAEEDIWIYTDWGYITPELYDASLGYLEGTAENPNQNPLMGDPGYYLRFDMPQVKLMQFAVTDIPPKYDTVEDILNGGLFYTGAISLLTEKTREIINDNDIYTRPPFIKSTTPSVNGKLTFGKKYDITLEYDRDLEQIEGQEMQVVIQDALGADKKTKATAIENSKIENVKFDLENRKVSFKFTPSDMFADNETIYNIGLKGVIGVDSQKVPAIAEFAVGYLLYYCPICIANGYPLEVFAQPELMDPTGLKVDDLVDTTLDEYKDLAGVDLSQITNRLSLITTETTPQENQDMLDLIKGSEEFKDDVIEESQTYNIRLTLCNGNLQKIKDGMYLRVCVGFPEGTTYEDYLSGKKEFKVYHYNYDKDGAITGVEEIPVQVVRQGLILYIKSFSPFTIAALKGTGVAPIEKKLVLATAAGGTITYEGDVSGETTGQDTIDMEDDEKEVKIVIQADDDKIIEKVTLGDKILEITDKSTMEYTVKSDDLEAGTTRLYASFISKAVEEADAANGEVQIVAGVPSFTTSLEVDQDVIDNLKAGDTFEVTAKLSNFQNITNGLVALGGKFEYNKDVFELTNIEGLAGWKIDFDVDYDVNSQKFIMDRQNNVKPEAGESLDLFKATFKVLDIKKEVEEIISVTGITAGEGNEKGPISGGNAQVIISVPEVEEIDSISSDVYVINKENKTISKVEQKTTLEEFMSNVVVTGDVKLTDNTGKTIQDSDIIKTGTKVKVGDSIEYTIVVTGDIDGYDGEITVNDLAVLKLHLVKLNIMTDPIKLMAADVDYDGEVDINDLAVMKLILIKSEEEI